MIDDTEERGQEPGGPTPQFDSGTNPTSDEGHPQTGAPSGRASNPTSVDEGHSQTAPTEAPAGSLRPGLGIPVALVLLGAAAIFGSARMKWGLFEAGTTAADVTADFNTIGTEYTGGRVVVAVGVVVSVLAIAAASVEWERFRLLVATSGAAGLLGLGFAVMNAIGLYRPETLNAPEGGFVSERVSPYIGPGLWVDIVACLAIAAIGLGQIRAIRRHIVESTAFQPPT